MSDRCLASFMPTSPDIASREETQYGFSEADIMASEAEKPIIPVCPG